MGSKLILQGSILRREKDLEIIYKEAYRKTVGILWLPGISFYFEKKTSKGKGIRCGQLSEKKSYTGFHFSIDVYDR